MHSHVISHDSRIAARVLSRLKTCDRRIGDVSSSCLAIILSDSQLFFHFTLAFAVTFRVGFRVRVRVGYRYTVVGSDLHFCLS